ncbi:MAG TPA: gpW family head-tail joining protein [Burkholderiales bacterium]|nr:gpW family head-tail joining protein [Burkholderiales bacterium]
MADLTTLQIWLADAEAALQALQIGAQEMQIDHGDMRVAYTKADTARLQSYIDSLRAQIAAAGGTVSGLRRRALMVDL